MLIGIYWGKFDPPHMGHEQVVRACLEAGFDLVYLVPQYNVPEGAAYPRRTAWLQAFAQLFSPSQVGVSTMESWLALKRSGPVTLIDVLRALAQDPDAAYRLVMGTPEWETYAEPDRAEIEAEFSPWTMTGQIITSTDVRARLTAQQDVSDVVPRGVLDLMFDLAEQPPPVPASAGPAIWDLVQADMRRRDELGQARYGTRLRPFNGRKALRDAYEEVLDLAVYLRQLIYEQEGR